VKKAPHSANQHDGWRRLMLLSFSGIDGAGKTTQIQQLHSRLSQAGFRICKLSFWDDVAVLSRFREGITHRLFGSEKGVGAPGLPVERRDKNLRAWYLTLSRHWLYLLDALHLCWIVRRLQAADIDVLIFDRYIYDELANLPLRSHVARLYLQFVNRIVPAPDVAYLLDVEPSLAQQRKPEYPVKFLCENRQCFLEMALSLENMKVIRASGVDEAQDQIMQMLTDSDLRRQELCSQSTLRP